MNELLKNLEKISSSVGTKIDYTQGGGGNTSVKLDDRQMAVKASGFKLKQITPTDGYVVVDYKNIAQYHKTVDTSRDVDLEKESSAFVSQNILDIEGLKKLRPSVEAGFHSILKKYVVHTHPVYANIVCCSNGGEALARKILAGKPYEMIWIPYINPGFSLTLKMHEEIEKCKKGTGVFPSVVFMENHGLVTTSDDADEALALHYDVNNTIKEYLGIDDFPALKLDREGDKFVSKTPFVEEFLKTHPITVFDEFALYPDQLVYLNSNLKDGKIKYEGGKLCYDVSASEAETVEETLLAYIFVIDAIEKKGLGIHTMGQAGIDFINNWESEKYRKSLAK